MPANIEAEFQFLGLWVHNERGKHHPNAGWATVSREPNVVFSAHGSKCEREDGKPYFLFPHSSTVSVGDLITWGSYPDDQWVVTAINRTSECLSCEVRRPEPRDKSVDSLLRSDPFTKAAEYLANAKARLEAGTVTGWGDCVANCRNALQEVVTQLTGEQPLSAGLKKLRDVCNLGEKETEQIETLERLFRTSRDVLSKSGAHPPTPEYPFAAFALGMTSETIRFLLATRKAG
jgi:hypothetical protein